MCGKSGKARCVDTAQGVMLRCVNHRPDPATGIRSVRRAPNPWWGRIDASGFPGMGLRVLSSPAAGGSKSRLKKEN